VILSGRTETIARLILNSRMEPRVPGPLCVWKEGCCSLRRAYIGSVCVCGRVCVSLSHSLSLSLYIYMFYTHENVCNYTSSWGLPYTHTRVNRECFLADVSVARRRSYDQFSNRRFFGSPSGRSYPPFSSRRFWGQNRSRNLRPKTIKNRTSDTLNNQN
jgi:hypothetical protein